MAGKIEQPKAPFPLEDLRSESDPDWRRLVQPKPKRRERRFREPSWLAELASKDLTEVADELEERLQAWLKERPSEARFRTAAIILNRLALGPHAVELGGPKVGRLLGYFVGKVVSAIVYAEPGLQPWKTAQSFCVSSLNRYRPVRGAELVDQGFFKQISSVSVHSISQEASLYLVTWHPMVGWLPNFDGEFLELTDANVGTGVSFDLETYAFDNYASSLLLVRRDPTVVEYRVSWKALFSDSAKALLEQTFGAIAHLDGDPIMTWAMFPLQAGLDQTKIYLVVHQCLTHGHWYGVRDSGGVTYYFLLTIDPQGHLRGQVVHHSVWATDAGLRAKLDAAAAGSYASFTSSLQQKLNSDVPGQIKEFYYLPGNQPVPATTGAKIGKTYSDTTIVVLPV
jgi:hypothetical protein